MTKIAFLNPNATDAMTQDMVVAARSFCAEGVHVIGYTNSGGPPAIQGPEDAEESLPGLFDIASRARDAGADVLVVGCFDDTGLARLRTSYRCPVIGLGEAACLIASVSRPRFLVVTTTQGSVPEIAGNIDRMGLTSRCCGVFAADVPVLELENKIDTVKAVLEEQAQRYNDAALVLGCAGMSSLAERLAAGVANTIIDANQAAVSLAQCVLVSRVNWYPFRGQYSESTANRTFAPGQE